jgi:serine carboxypeptidase-like clade 2
MGPWRPTADQKLYYNPYSWTNISSMVFLSQPVDVGFSYSTVSENYNDILSGIDNVIIIKEFFRKFPERSLNSFYIASESYGGHYIPQLTLLLFDVPEYATTFKGYLVGNPYTGFNSGDIAMAHTVWGLQLVPYPTWQAFVAQGCSSFSSDPYTYSDACTHMLNQLNVLPGNLNPYALTYPMCVTGGGNAQGKHLMRILGRRGELSSRYALQSETEGSFDTHRRNEKTSVSSPLMRVYTAIKRILLSKPISLSSRESPSPTMPLLPDEEGIERVTYDACTESYIAPYLNAADVRAALHVEESPHHWSECADVVFGNWPIADYYADTVPSYREIYNSPRRPADFRMLVFSGDVDGVCATAGTQAWIYDVVANNLLTNLSTSLAAAPSHFWYPWRVSGQQAGYITLFDGNLAFATVHSAGHEVPGYQPRRALRLYNLFLNGSMFGQLPPPSHISIYLHYSLMKL